MHRTLRAHKIASSTYRLGLGHEVEILEEGLAATGNVVLVEALEEKRIYSALELVSGRMAKILKGDLIVGVLGGRTALKGFVGRVPDRLAPGDRLHVLNLGGVIGTCTSMGGDLGRPLETRFLGMVVVDGVVQNIAIGAVPERETLGEVPPLVLIGGSCMNSGKTVAACEIVAGLTARGHRVAAAKVSGVACLRDTLNMIDHGAVRAYSFLDCGHPSTARFETIVPLTKGILRALTDEVSPDVIVIELGDGIIGQYGPASLFEDEELRATNGLVVYCANDLVAAWGGRAYLERMGIEIAVLSGPATDNEVGIEYARDALQLPAANARSDPEKLTGLVVQALSQARRTASGIAVKNQVAPGEAG